MPDAALEGLCAAVLPPEHGGPEPRGLAARAEAYLQRVPAPERAAMRAGAAALDAWALATGGCRLAGAAPAARERVLDRWSGPPATAAAVELLKAVILLAAGTDAHRDDLLERSTREPPARADPPLPVTDAADWPTTATADVVVVGSGAGGAMAARRLARAGADVVVLEEGPTPSTEEFRTADPLDRFATYYRDAGATAAVGLPPVLLPIGTGVGGSTIVNSGTCYRPPHAVLRRWRDAEGLALADPEALGPRFDDVERTLGVAPVPAGVMGRNGEVLLAGAAALGWDAGPLERAAPGCGGCCQCSIGCPRGAKAGVHLNALPQAAAAGARLVGGVRVDRVLTDDRGGGGGALGVRGRRPDGTAVEVRAPRVVLAAGATETPALLARSGLDRHPRCGANLSLHPAIGVAGRFDEPIVAWKGVLQSAAIEEFHDDGILVEATAAPPGMGSIGLPGHGRGLLAELAESEHHATAGALVADGGGGRVRHVAGRTAITYRLGTADAARLLRAVGIMGRALLAAGAREVRHGLADPSGRPAPPARDGAGLDAAVTAADPRRLRLASFHPAGTVAGGAEPERHPADPAGALRGARGVWVADAALLPSCPTVNPQVAIMALAQAVADEVARC